MMRFEKAVEVERIVREGRRLIFYRRPHDRRRPPVYLVKSAWCYRRLPESERADDLPLAELPHERVPHLVVRTVWVGDEGVEETFRIEGEALDRMYEDATKDLCLSGGRIFRREGKLPLAVPQPAPRRRVGGVALTRAAQGSATAGRRQT